MTMQNIILKSLEGKMYGKISIFFNFREIGTCQKSQNKNH